MIEVVLSNGDRAEAETCEAAVFAAATLMREANGASGSYYERLTVAFYTDGLLVRQGVRMTELASGL